MIASFLDKIIFPRANPAYLTYSRLKDSEIYLDAGWLVSLQGWRIEGKKGMEGPVGLYFGGNAEDVSQGIESFLDFGFRAVYSFNYRGYGLSGGKPAQEALYEDSLSIYSYIKKNEHMDLSHNLVMIGRSLGASVATYASTKCNVKSVILVTPFKNMRSLVVEKEKWLPAHWFLKQPFQSDQYATINKNRMLMILAEHDTLIPNSNSLELFRAWVGQKEVNIIKNTDHNDLHLEPEYSLCIRKFLYPHEMQ